jgi:hypothetical protein
MAGSVAAQPQGDIATGTKFDVAPGASVNFRAVNGEATFLETPGNQVVVFYARDVPADVKIVTFTTPQGLTVCTVYVSTDPKKPTECLPDGSGRLAAGRIRDQSRVRFRIQVPPGVHVNASIDQGDLKANAITGNLHLYSNNGNVLVVDGGGPGTINAGAGLLGNVDAMIAKAQKGPARREVKLSVVGGGQVRVAMPSDVAASYRISTQRPAYFAPVFGERKTEPGLLSGHVGPLGEQVYLNVETGISGRFGLLPAKP